MSFGRYVDHANMSEERVVSMSAVKTQTVDSSKRPFQFYHRDRSL